MAAPLTDFLISEDNATVGRTALMGLSNGVSVVANSSGPYESFTAVAKHLQGNTMYGVDGDVALLYQGPTTLAVGTILAITATNTPVSVINTDQFTGIGGYVVK